MSSSIQQLPTYTPSSEPDLNDNIMAESKEPDQVFTSADRIRQLNDVDNVSSPRKHNPIVTPVCKLTSNQDIAKLIQSAGLAIQALTNARSGDTDASTPTSAATSLDARKKRFQEATSQYFALLSSIDVRLRRQVYALEEAAILAPDSASRTSDGPGAAGGAAAAPASSLDISWLNSRKDTVGKDKEAELWAAAREFVERNVKRPVDESDGGDGREKMEVD